jgi:hypothetical protein
MAQFTRQIRGLPAAVAGKAKKGGQIFTSYFVIKCSEGQNANPLFHSFASSASLAAKL